MHKKFTFKNANFQEVCILCVWVTFIAMGYMQQVGYRLDTCMFWSNCHHGAKRGCWDSFESNNCSCLKIGKQTEVYVRDLGGLSTLVCMASLCWANIPWDHSILVPSIWTLSYGNWRIWLPDKCVLCSLRNGSMWQCVLIKWIKFRVNLLLVELLQFQNVQASNICREWI